MTLLKFCARRPRSPLASGMRASIEANHQDDVPHVCVCGRKRQAMPRPRLCHPVRLQPPYASRGRSAGQRSCPATGRFDRCVFFASGWLVWCRWLAPWPRSSQIPYSLSGLRVSSGLTASILCMSRERSMCGPASRYGHARPMGVRLACGVHVL